MSAKSFTERQGQYLAFIDAYTRVHGRPPAETDMQRHFQLSPPSVHQMVLTLERLGHIRRQPGVARSIEVLLAPEDLPVLRHPNRSNPLCRGTSRSPAAVLHSRPEQVRLRGRCSWDGLHGAGEASSWPQRACYSYPERVPAPSPHVAGRKWGFSYRLRQTTSIRERI